MKEIGKIQFITHALNSSSLLKQVEEVAKSDINIIQFRMKEENYETKLLLGEKLAAICSQHNKKLIINDDVYIAKSLNADGVHLGLVDMNPIKAREILGENAIIGATCNSIDDIINRHHQGVDYIGLGPFRFTDTKKNLAPTLGYEGYKRIIEEMKKLNINIPIIAIGGIKAEDIPRLMQTGIHGIALSSLITKADNKIELINQIHNAIN
jgi:thiamine-phosphate pyrophosphorylase